MKFLKHFLIAFVVILLAPTMVLAQSITPANQDPIYQQWGHVIQERSFTFEANVDMGGLTLMARTVERAHSDNPTDWIPIPAMPGVPEAMLQYFTVNGLDSVQIPVPYHSGSWNFRITYSAPGGWCYVIVIEQVEVKAPATASVHDPYINGLTLHFNTIVTRYNANESGQFWAYERILLYSDGVLADSIIYQVSSAGDYNEWENFTFNLTWVPPGLLCIKVELYYWHENDGQSDFGPQLIVSSPGNNCVPWAGLSTGGVCEAVELVPCELRMFPNPASSLVTVEGFKPNVSIMILATNGQIIRSASTTPSGDQLVIDVSDLAVGAYSLQQEGAKGCQFVKE